MLRKDWFETHVSRPELNPDDGAWSQLKPPGDGRGAGGFDSWMFTHLERNWLRKVAKPNEEKPKSRKRPASSPVAKKTAKKVVKRIGEMRGTDWMKDKSGMVYRKVPANQNLLNDKKEQKSQARKRTNVVVIPQRPLLGTKRLNKRDYDETDKNIITGKFCSFCR